MYGVVRQASLPPWLTSREDVAVPTHKVSLANVPTPLHPLSLSDKLLPRHLGVELFVKRDDFTGSELSGNKIRKLEYILADVIEKGCDTVVTIGGIQSNHCRATVAAANALGLEAHVVLRTSRLDVDRDPGVEGNLLVSRLANAHFHLVTKEEYAKFGQRELGRRVVEELKKAGKCPYLIVVGGSSPMGTLGYVSMIDELDEQLAADAIGDGNSIDRMVVACGSGGTVAGIALGLALCPRFRNTTLDAVMVCDNELYFTEYITGLYTELGMSPERAKAIVSDRVRFIQGKGGGYAISRDEELDTTLDVASESSICLDPTYTGKALHYWLEHVRRAGAEYAGKRVLYVHTGGLGSLYGNEALERRAVSRGRDRWSRLIMPQL